MMLLATANLLDYMRAGIDVVAMPKMFKAKRAATNGREVWCSYAIHDLCVKPNDPEAWHDAERIEVVQVENLKREWHQVVF